MNDQSKLKNLLKKYSQSPPFHWKHRLIVSTSNSRTWTADAHKPLWFSVFISRIEAARERTFIAVSDIPWNTLLYSGKGITHRRLTLHQRRIASLFAHSMPCNGIYLKERFSGVIEKQLTFYTKKCKYIFKI